MTKLYYACGHSDEYEGRGIGVWLNLMVRGNIVRRVSMG